VRCRQAKKAKEIGHKFSQQAGQIRSRNMMQGDEKRIAAGD
jgi:hypothetical protein